MLDGLEGEVGGAGKGTDSSPVLVIAHAQLLPGLGPGASGRKISSEANEKAY